MSSRGEKTQRMQAQHNQESSGERETEGKREREREFCAALVCVSECDAPTSDVLK